MKTRGFNFPSLLRFSLLILFLLSVYIAFRLFDLSSVFNPARIVTILNALGWASPFVFIAFMASAVVISPIPSLPLDIAAGIAYGPYWGTAFAVTGAEIGAVLSFLIARRLGRDAVTRFLGTGVFFCEKCSDRHLAGLVFIARLFPVFSFDVVSYGAGLTGMSVKIFALATLLGMIPPTFTFTLLGKGLAFDRGWTVIAALGLTALFLFLPKWIVRFRSTGWVRLLQGETPNPPVKDLESSALPPGDPPQRRICSACGGPVE